MRASELGSFNRWLADSPLASDRLWQRDLEQVSDMEITLFYARAGLMGLKGHAVQSIEQLQTAIILAGIDGTALPKGVMRLVTHQTPVERFAVDEFIDKLVKLSAPRRAAVLYALTMNETPEDVAALTWSDTTHLRQLPEQVRDILAARGRVRHLKMPYVFWEWATEKIAAPLLQLAVTAEDAFGAPWPKIQQRYSTMLWISGGADAASFNHLVEEVAAGRL